MKTKDLLVSAAVTLSLIPMISMSTNASTTKPVQYQCTKCHMKVTAAIASADHYRDPMDGGKLVPVPATPAKPAKPAKPTGRMQM
jgi:hypothetical protein